MFGANLQHVRQLALAASVEISLHSYVRHPSPEELEKKALEAAANADPGETRPLFQLGTFAKAADTHPYDDDPNQPRLKSTLTREDLLDDYRLQQAVTVALRREKSEAGIGTIEMGCWEHDGGVFLPCFDSKPGVTRQQLEAFLSANALAQLDDPTKKDPLFHLVGAKIFDTGKGFHVIADHFVKSSHDDCTINDWLDALEKLDVVDDMWLDYLDKDDDLILRVTAGPGRPEPRELTAVAA